ncbi:hypothetical protein [Streptomyces tendae]|uniref:hypothetical protein n=1 Tax=Streptomyces tendae TaxID=1932 RepID=UPI0013302CD7|nr:hypothetical protein [Streptomyces tendae]
MAREKGPNVSATARRVFVWAVAAVCLAVVVWLVVAASLDLPTGDSTASVVAAVVAVIGLALSVVTLLRTPGGTAPAARRSVRVRGRGAVGAGGDVRDNAFGPGARVTGAPTPASRRPAGAADSDVDVRGRGSVGAGGDVAGNALGEDSER